MKRFYQINVIPMIDVMLVLLAIVLTSASFIVQDKLNIDLPETQQTQNYTPPENLSLRLAINAENQYFLNDQPIAFTDLEHQLQQTDPDQPIELRVDQKAEFGPFTKVIDLLKKYQLNQLNILTRKHNA